MKVYIDLKSIRGTIKGEARDCGVTSLSIAGGYLIVKRGICYLIGAETRVKA